MFDSMRRMLGLYPRKLETAAFNPNGLHAAFARASNAYHAPYRDAEGSLHIKDPFGFLGGYQVPLPDDLKMKAGTVYPTGMQLITQPLWDQKTYTDNSTTSLSFFNAVTSGITGNMDLAGAISFPKSFIIRTIRFVPQISNSFTSTGGVVGVAWNDISLLVFNSYHTLNVLSKQYLRIPSFMLPSGTGLGNTAAAGTFTAEAQIVAGNFGIADPRATYTLLDPLWLETQVGFTYTVTWSAAQQISGNQTLTVVMDGQMIQPVQ